jgi:hypothetical protein
MFLSPAKNLPALENLVETKIAGKGSRRKRFTPETIEGKGKYSTRLIITEIFDSGNLQGRKPSTPEIFNAGNLFQRKPSTPENVNHGKFQPATIFNPRVFFPGANISFGGYLFSAGTCSRRVLVLGGYLFSAGT